MTMKMKLGIGVVVALCSYLIVGKFGADAGIAQEHLETTKGLLVGISSGLMVWLIFDVIRGWWKKPEA